MHVEAGTEASEIVSWRRVLLLTTPALSATCADLVPLIGSISYLCLPRRTIEQDPYHYDVDWQISVRRRRDWTVQSNAKSAGETYLISAETPSEGCPNPATNWTM